MKKPLAMLALAVSVAGLGAGSAFAAPPAPTDVNPAGRALTCHVTSSASNPVVEIYVTGQSQAPARPCEDTSGGGTF
jgi:hypothetical protein